tara:strand:- start:389 stop:634 length:246 start_codon:yes stop_codon:yes gene_type:complete
MTDNIYTLREVVRWADCQDENYWAPVDESKMPTMAQIARAYELVGLDDTVFSIEDALEQFSAFDRKKYLDLCSALNREPVG